MNRNRIQERSPWETAAGLSHQTNLGETAGDIAVNLDSTAANVAFVIVRRDDGPDENIVAPIESEDQ